MAGWPRAELAGGLLALDVVSHVVIRQLYTYRMREHLVLDRDHAGIAPHLEQPQGIAHELLHLHGIG